MNCKRPNLTEATNVPYAYTLSLADMVNDWRDRGLTPDQAAHLLLDHAWHQGLHCDIQQLRSVVEEAYGLELSDIFIN